MKLLEYISKQRGLANRLAESIDVPPVLISQWANQKRSVPLDRCVQIEQATEGQVTCEELRPDKAWYWSYLRTTCTHIGTSPAVAAEERTP